MPEKNNISKAQLDSWFQGKSNRERFVPEVDTMKADRANWLSLFGKEEKDVLTDEAGEYIMAEIEQEPVNNGEPQFIFNKMKLPESIQSVNINL